MQVGESELGEDEAAIDNVRGSAQGLDRDEGELGAADELEGDAQGLALAEDVHLALVTNEFVDEEVVEVETLAVAEMNRSVVGDLVAVDGEDHIAGLEGVECGRDGGDTSNLRRDKRGKEKGGERMRTMTPVVLSSSLR